ncbi:MAG: DNA translocase FtsK 4TM domain-containing protein [Proteobacteria bacterium]|nr:DNA translocase FtsK 4TM domain-containing protein [Pseudomonadota bacterium]MBU1715033.1 DNA translocase FtsK 4TM domain-containing protein [Pseudomonadota bacterium]
MISVLGIFFAVFILICLAGFSLPGASPGIVPAAMWGGKVGYFISSILMSFLGISSFWIVLLVFVFSLHFFSPQASIRRLPYICAGCTGIIIASTGLLATTNIARLELFGHSYPMAGYLGKFLSFYAGKYFGVPGSVLIFFSVLFSSLMVSIEFSPYMWWKSMLSAYGNLREMLAARKNIEHTAPVKESFPKDALPKVYEEPVIKELISTLAVKELVRLTADDEDGDFQPLPVNVSNYKLPPLSLLDKPIAGEFQVDREHYLDVSKQLEHKLKDFGVSGKVSGISPGPVITTYEFEPAPGIKINKIVSLADDLAMALKAVSVRIVGSIPGKAALGIEIPNPERQIVYIKDILASEEFQKSTSKLTIGLGMDVVGNPVMANLAKMPHLLIAGATGAGKSVAVNAIISSILYKATPEDVRMLMVDPKRIELSCYENIPHLLHPVVVDPKMASRALQWAVREMERRYELMEEYRVKNITGFNEVAEEHLPLIVIIIDELADLMMVSSREVEDSVARLAQMARAAGMHLILATQRPSVDVLTGLIKANFPTRMSFKVSSKIDSRTILDSSGAEHLLGAGDMLFLPPGSGSLQRIHGAYISEKETERIVEFLKSQGQANYDESMLKIAQDPEESGGGVDEDYDEKYDEAIAIVCETGQASISMLQRRMRVGYNRAARMIEMMEKEGVVGPSDGSKPREVLARTTY